MARIEKSKIIYCDTAATTHVATEVQKEISKHLRLTFGNAGSIHTFGTEAKDVLVDCRKVVADFLYARPKEIIFTSGGTEANNLAVIGTYNYCIENGLKPNELHFITSNIEHSSIKNVFIHLQGLGCKVDFLPVEKTGRLNPNLLRKSIRENTVLISLAYANSEIGVIQPVWEIIKEIRFARKNNIITERIGAVKFPYFHLDASQATLWLPMGVDKLGVDLMTLDSQKIYGPKGVGVLFLKSGTRISPIMFGGQQEFGLRPGTENIPQIAGMSKAIKMIPDFQKKHLVEIRKARDYFYKEIQHKIPSINLSINGEMENRLPNNLNFSILGSDAEYLLLQLAEKGIFCSAKSACLTEDIGSYVVAAVSEDPKATKSSLRFTFDKGISKKDVDYIVKVLTKDVFHGGLIQ